MKKSELFEEYNKLKEEGKEVELIILSIHMPTGETESIVNPNAETKMAYIDKTYNEDLVHSNCKDIYIEDAIFNISGDDELMDFGEAIECMKEGYKVARQGWNGKNQYIELAIAISYVNTDGEIINCEHEAIGNKAIAFVGTSGVQMGWLASQADMLAEDWVLVDPEKTESKY